MNSDWMDKHKWQTTHSDWMSEHKWNTVRYRFFYTETETEAIEVGLNMEQYLQFGVFLPQEDKYISIPTIPLLDEHRMYISAISSAHPVKYSDEIENVLLQQIPPPLIKVLKPNIPAIARNIKNFVEPFLQTRKSIPV